MPCYTSTATAWCASERERARAEIRRGNYREYVQRHRLHAVHISIIRYCMRILGTGPEASVLPARFCSYSYTSNFVRRASSALFLGKSLLSLRLPPVVLRLMGSIILPFGCAALALRRFYSCLAIKYEAYPPSLLNVDNESS